MPMKNWASILSQLMIYFEDSVRLGKGFNLMIGFLHKELDKPTAALIRLITQNSQPEKKREF